MAPIAPMAPIARMAPIASVFETDSKISRQNPPDGLSGTTAAERQAGRRAGVDSCAERQRGARSAERRNPAATARRGSAPRQSTGRIGTAAARRAGVRWGNGRTRRGNRTNCSRTRSPSTTWASTLAQIPPPFASLPPALSTFRCTKMSQIVGVPGLNCRPMPDDRG